MVMFDIINSNSNLIISYVDYFTHYLLC